MEFFSNANCARHLLDNVGSVSRQISSVQLYFLNLFFIYLAASGSSCGTQDLCRVMCNISLQHAGVCASSVIALCWLSSSRVFGILVP